MVSVKPSVFFTIEMPFELRYHLFSGCSFNCVVKAAGWLGNFKGERQVLEI